MKNKQIKQNMKNIFYKLSQRYQIFSYFYIKAKVVYHFNEFFVYCNRLTWVNEIFSLLQVLFCIYQYIILFICSMQFLYMFIYHIINMLHLLFVYIYILYRSNVACNFFIYILLYYSNVACIICIHLACIQLVPMISSTFFINQR